MSVAAGTVRVGGVPGMIGALGMAGDAAPSAVESREEFGILLKGTIFRATRKPQSLGFVAGLSE